jgi:hypothetical protein
MPAAGVARRIAFRGVALSALNPALSACAIVAQLNCAPNLSSLIMIRIAFSVVMLLLCTTADAYIGPGSGIGLLGSLWAWIVGLLIVFFAVLIWPIRWLLRRARAPRSDRKLED